MTDVHEIFAHHGGRLKEAALAFPDAPKPWLDLSTGINPQSWPMQQVSLSCYDRLPDPCDVFTLEAAAAAVFGTAADRVAAVPGAEAGLRALPDILRLKSVSIVSPTYGSHENAWRSAGAKVSIIDNKSVGNLQTGAVVLVNPNNPDGHLFEPALIKNLIARQTARDGWTIIDESFIDPTPAFSIASEAGNRLVVIRSFGKFFGLPGLRLGFVLADPAVASCVRQRFGDWPLSPQALESGLHAYRDISWQENSRQRLAEDALRLEQILSAAGFTSIGGGPLFQLVRSDNARDWFRHLANQGILTRPFSGQPSWLRFGLPARKEWPRLERALEQGRATITSRTGSKDLRDSEDARS